MFSGALEQKARDLLDRYRRAGKRAATAESCTGGLIAACITHVAGSSDVFERGFVTYSNDAKMDMLGVPLALLEAHGAVSSEVARAMAEGAITRSRADVAVSVTGIAGPGGGTAEKPVGLVWFGVSHRDAVTLTERRVFSGDRAAVRLATLEHALALFEGALPP
jgi:nicotinamide-nucleotide amidase